MRILTRYVTHGFLFVFAITMIVITFVMTLMVLFTITDLVAKGGNLMLILRIFAAGMPSALGISIPVSILTASLLTFGSLSANGEITAMKASGIGMRRIIRGPVLFAVLMTSLAVHLQGYVIPRGWQMRREAILSIGIDTPLRMLEEGRYVRDFPGIMFYFGARDGDRLSDIRIYVNGDDGVQRHIRAQEGRLRADEDSLSLAIDLYEVRIDPFYADRPGVGFARHMPFSIDLSRLRPDRPTYKRRSDMTFDELNEQIEEAAAIPDAGEAAQQASRMRVEIHKRLVFSLASFAFVLLGIGLAIKTHRRESSLGIAMSLGLVFLFYLFIVLAESRAAHPTWHPHLLMWIPVMLSCALGVILIRRCD